MYCIIAARHALPNLATNPADEYDRAVVIPVTEGPTENTPSIGECLYTLDGYEFVLLGCFPDVDEACLEMDAAFSACSTRIAPDDWFMPVLPATRILAARRALPLTELSHRDTAVYTRSAAENLHLAPLSDAELEQVASHVHAVAEHDGLSLHLGATMETLEDLRRL
ncbi:hypothetical protein SAMN05421853_11446 [Roseivivax halotolerans]|uniref:Uncharacterized protein n=1 Tax=Roseivivax halotolerans TaxID=93684 RepID=A0A1I6A2M4_9RHOB|nr:hypothetical protein [Roseivivax halotolerans]SFQ62797.1 hypothetical protein SAMN05421853_11446 [Roseivivax halotolerans]